MNRSLKSMLASLPPPWPEDLLSEIGEMLAQHAGRKLVVLDDDPTGTQTVYDVPVLTSWEVETLQRELQTPGACFYILTNSRSLAAAQAEERIREVARNLKKAACLAAGISLPETGGDLPGEWREICSRAFTLVSRSDSTLRGHFPLETDVLAEEIGPFDATLLMPYFHAGGRFTIDDVHYVADGDNLVPAAETPFALDAVFGYKNSNLRQWVEEKTKGRVRAQEVGSFSLEELRSSASGQDGIEHVSQKLLSMRGGAVAVANACHPRDAQCFV